MTFTNNIGQSAPTNSLFCNNLSTIWKKTCQKCLSCICLVRRGTYSAFMIDCLNNTDRDDTSSVIVIKKCSEQTHKNGRGLCQALSWLFNPKTLFLGTIEKNTAGKKIDEQSVITYFGKKYIFRQYLCIFKYLVRFWC